jgi:hypothetical protein
VHSSLTLRYSNFLNSPYFHHHQELLLLHLSHATPSRCQALIPIRYATIAYHDFCAITNYMKTPLDSRYSSDEMKKLFSARSRYSVWRKLWYFLAQAEKEVGLEGISDEALAQMADHLVLTDDDFVVAAVEEKKRRHDVVSFLTPKKCSHSSLTKL